MANMSSDRTAYNVTLTARVNHECSLKTFYLADAKCGFETEEVARWMEMELGRWESKYGSPEEVTLTIRPHRKF